MSKLLIERRAELAGKRIDAMRRTLGDGRPDFSAEERSNWDRLNSDFNNLTRQIEQERDRDARRSIPGLEDRVSRTGLEADSGGDEMRRAMCVQAWFRIQSGMSIGDEHRQACVESNFNPRSPELSINLPKRALRPDGIQSRANMSIGTAATGGNTVPTGFVYQLEASLLDASGVRQVADVRRTDGGDAMPWPTVDDTSNTGELLAEGASIGGSANGTFGQVVFGAYKFSSKPVIISNELLEDSAFEFAREVPIMLGERIGRCQEGYFTTGTGSSQPQGVVAGSTLGVTAISQTKIGPTEIIDLIHSVDPAYRRDPSFRLMAHDLVWAEVRKIRDGTGRFLYESVKDGGPDRVHGVRIAVNQSMASTLTASAKPLIAGAMRKFKIRDVRQIRVKRLDERWGDTDQTGFVAFVRSDSHVLDAGTHPIRYLQMAA